MLPSLHRLSLRTLAVDAKDAKRKVRKVLYDDDSTAEEEPEADRRVAQRVAAPRAAAPAAAAEEVDDGDGNDIKLLVLGFDGTLTRRGGTASGNVMTFMDMGPEGHAANFGGAREVARIRALLTRLRAAQVELRILSYGSKSSIIVALGQTGLLDFFSAPGEPLGSLIWGSDTPPLDEPDTYKAIVVQEWMAEEDLDPDEVAFLDDRRENVDTPEAGDDNVGVAQVLAPGHAKLHEGDTFTASQAWIEGICGLG